MKMYWTNCFPPLKLPNNNKCRLLILCAGLFLSFISESQQRPIGTFTKLFDRNGDGQVDISKEIGAHFERIQRMMRAKNISLPGVDLADLDSLLGDAQLDLAVKKRIDESDKDGDRRLSLEELENAVHNFAVAILDKNHDGLVSEKESEDYDASMMALQFRMYDTNQDQKLNAKELEAMTKKYSAKFMAMFSKMMSAAGEIPLEEAKGVFGKLGAAPEQIAAAEIDHNGHVSIGEFMDHIGIPTKTALKLFGSLFGSLVDRKMVERADEDGNGLLTFDEQMNMLFVQLVMKMGDADKDGRLDEKEFIVGFAKMHSKIPVGGGK